MKSISKLAQACFQSNPTLIVGSGASMPHGLPSMWDLQQYLLDHIVTVDEGEDDAWLLV